MGNIVRYEPLVSAPNAASGGGNVWDGAGYTGYNIRGIEGNRVAMDVDGIALPPAPPKPDGNSLNSFAQGRNFIDPSMLASVDIASGTTGAGRGSQGLGGGVGFRTKNPDDLLRQTDKRYRLEYTPSYFSANNSFGNAFSGAAGDKEVQALAIFSRRDGRELDAYHDNPQNPVDWHSNAGLGKVVWSPSDIHSFNFSADYYKYDGDSDLRNKTATNYPDGAIQNSIAERTTFAIGHTLKPADDFVLFDKLDTKLYYQTTETTDDTITPRYITGGVTYRRNLTTSFENDTFGFNADAVKQLSNHRIGYGLATSYGTSKRPWEEVRTRLSDGAVTGGTKDRMAPIDTTTLAGYIRDDITFNPGPNRIILAPGARVEYWNFSPGDLDRYVTGVPSARNEIREEDEVFVNPSLGLTIGVTNNIDVYGKYNRGTRVPTPVEKTGTYDSFSYTGSGAGYAVLGNPDLKKETSDSFEAGFTGKSVHGVTFRACGFYTSYQNFIEYAAQPFDPAYPSVSFGLFRPENVGKAQIYGAETSVTLDYGAWEPGAAGFSTTFAAGFNDSRAENTTTGAIGRLPSVGPFKGVVTVAYDHPSGDFGVAFMSTYTASRQADADLFSGGAGNRFDVPDSLVFDLTGYWRINRYATLNVGVYNLTDEKYWYYASARGLAAPTTAANAASVAAASNPGINAMISLTLSY